jgi:hypothetical protein
MEHTILLALIIALALYAFYFRHTESFENDNATVKPRKECSDVAISKSIMDYQLSPLNQLKTPK